VHPHLIRSKLATALSLSFSAAAATAAPVGGAATSGAGSISQNGSTTTIQQTSANLSLAWKSFNVAAQETVNFLQPSASAIAINRIFDVNGSQILGRLNANGQVWLINPNGVLFGQGAQVNVGGLVASTLDVGDAAVSGSTRSFAGAGSGSVVNRGSIAAADGGYVALLGNRVGNEGRISARLGTVALGAGSAATLTFSGNSLVRMQVDRSVLDSAADNGGLIRADGGTVLMSAGAKDALLASVVNNTGVIEARTVESHEGTIVLMGGMAAGTTRVGGRLDASAPTGGNGGYIETSAATVQVAADTVVTTTAPAGRTGTWLIDPYNVTISNGVNNTGGSFAANADDSIINAATLQTALASTNVTVTTGSGGTQAGNITVSVPLTWSTATTLGLTAAGGIAINAPISITGAGGLALTATAQPGITTTGLTFGNGASVSYAGGGSIAGQSFSLNGNAYTLVYSMAQLDAMDAISAVNGSALAAYGSGAAGNYALATNLDATGVFYTRALFGDNLSTSTQFAGRFDGLGHTLTGLTINAPGTVTGVGLIGGMAAGSSVSNVALVGGSVSGGLRYVGALVGVTNVPTAVVQTSSASTAVTGLTGTGGLIGAHAGIVQASSASGTVTGNLRTGGLVGYIVASGLVNNSHASGTVSGPSSTGGLVGQIAAGTGVVQSSYATGAALSSSGGGLVGASSGGGVVLNSYWDTQTTGRATSVGGTGLTTAQLQGTTTVALGAAFTGGAAGGTAGLYPYLASAFPGGLQAVSGTAYKNAGSIAAASSTSGLVFVGLTLDGTAQTAVATGANGYYYFALPAGTIAPSGTVLLATTTANVATGTKNGAAIAVASGNAAGLDIYGGYLPFSTAATTYSTMQDTSATLLAMVSGFGTTPSFVAGLPSLISATGAGFTIDRALDVTSGLAVRTTAANSAITVTAPIMVEGAAALALTATGAIAVNAPIGLSNTASTTLTAGSALTVGASVTLADTTSATLTAGTALAVNAPITLSGANALTLASAGTLAIGQTVHVAGASSLTLTAAPQAGVTTTGLTFANGASIDYGAVDRGASFSLNGNVYKLVYSMGNLDAIDSVNAVDGSALTTYGSGLAGNYALATPLVATGTTYTRALIGTNSSGTSATQFAGRLDGLGNTVTGLAIAAGAADSVGLVGYLTGASSTVANMGLVGGSISGHDNVAVLVGMLDSATVQTSFATGTVDGHKSVGGLVGGTSRAPLIQASYATGAVTGFVGTGGLVGDLNFNSALRSSYATGAVTGGDMTGGLAGAVSVSKVYTSYSTGAVTGTTNTGGLIGLFNVGPSALVTASFWDTQTSGQSASAGGAGAIGMTTTQMRSQANFTSATAANGNVNPAWDLAGTWLMYDTITAPLLRSFLTPLTVTANTAVKTYDGAAYAGVNGVTYSTTPNGNLLGTVSYTDASQGAVNAGTYAVTPGSLYSNQQGYAISYASGGLTVAPASLTVAANTGNRLYGATNPAFSGSVSGFVGSDTLSNATTGSEVFGTTALVGSNVGSYAITGSGLSANNGNYVFVQAPGNATALTIAPATLTVTANTASRLYGAVEPAFSGTVGGFVAGDTLASATTGTRAYATNAVLNSNVGSYAVTGSGLVANNGNYVFVQAPGNATALTISPATLTYVSNAANRLYGATEPGFSGSVTGFVAGDSLAGATTGTQAYATNAVLNSNVGSYGITGGGLLANNGNYVFVQAANNAAALTITPATVTLTANLASRVVGAPEPPFSGTATGFVAGDTLESATTGSLSYATDALRASAPGRYAIDGNGLSANHGNYLFAQAPTNAGALTVVAAPPVDPGPPTGPTIPTDRLQALLAPLEEASGDAFFLGDGLSPVVKTRRKLPLDALPSLQVVASGLRLPADVLGSGR
jgi:filamentous hemagglutinin family protein